MRTHEHGEQRLVCMCMCVCVCVCVCALCVFCVSLSSIIIAYIRSHTPPSSFIHHTVIDAVKDTEVVGGRGREGNERGVCVCVRERESVLSVTERGRRANLLTQLDPQPRSTSTTLLSHTFSLPPHNTHTHTSALSCPTASIAARHAWAPYARQELARGAHCSMDACAPAVVQWVAQRCEREGHAYTDAVPKILSKIFGSSCNTPGRSWSGGTLRHGRVCACGGAA